MDKFLIKKQSAILPPKELLKVKLKPQNNQTLSEQFPMKSRPVYDKPFKEMTAVEKGDSMVWNVFDWLKSLDNITDIANISGISNNIFDIVVRTTYDKYLRGIQVKVLTQTHTCMDSWSSTLIDCDYPDNTLMIFVSPEKNRFGIKYWKDIPYRTNFRVDFYHKYCGDYGFTDVELFKKQLYAMIANTTIVYDVRDGILSDTDLKEYDSTRIIKQLCEQHEIKFEYNNTNGNSVDIYLNDHACQCKFSTRQIGNLYSVGSYKKVNSIHVPYNETDGIEYFIYQIESSEEREKYKNDILIVPISGLIRMGYITTTTQKGLTCILIPPPDGVLYHWMESLWNNFRLIQNHEAMISDPIYKFITKYNCKIKNTSKQDNVGCVFETSCTLADITDPNVDYYLVFINDTKTRLAKDKVCVIPKKMLVDPKFVPHQGQYSKSVRIAPPNYNKRSHHPSLVYWKNLSDLV